jgi:hypothetical protein
MERKINGSKIRSTVLGPQFGEGIRESGLPFDT